MSENVENKPNEPTKSNKEIDLGDLFTIIGNIFSKLFSFIQNILLISFDIIIKVLLIIRVHILKFIAVGVLSILVGWFLDSKKPPLFSSSITVKTNYGSARQLFSNIRYYNNLSEQADSITLSKVFNISPGEASKITGFFIEPNITENDIVKAYDEFMKESDTTVIKEYINYDKFKYNIDPLEYNRHKIVVTSVEQGIFNKLQDALITFNLENKYITKTKNVSLSNIEREQDALRKRLVVIDTLRKVYNKSILSEAKKTSSAQTNIQMSANTIKTNEIELLSLDDKISREIIQLERQKEFGEEVIEVLNDFSPGSEIKDFFNSFTFRIPVLTLALLLLFILLRELNKYLNTYAENKRLYA